LFRDCSPHVANLIERFGAERVWDAGIDVLKYPPTWAPDGFEILTLAERLNENGKA
jgi:hypothetical protein